MRSLLEKIANALAFIAEMLCAVFTTVLVAVLFMNVVGRFCFSHSFPWAEEVSKYLIIWVSMLAVSILIKNSELITVDFFDVFWSKKLIKYRNLTYQLIMFVIFGILLKEGWLMAVEGRNVSIASLKISWFWPYLSIPVGVVLILIQLFIVMIKQYYYHAEKGDA